MSKQLKLDSFWKKKVASTTSLITKVEKKRNFEETKTLGESTESSEESRKHKRNKKSTYKEGEYSYPFWWNKEKENMLQV